MRTEIGFEFPIDGSGQWDGFNDPGIEHFTGNRLQHLGREVPQNTIDAKIISPARIRVELKRVPVKSIPAVEELRQAVDRCLTAASSEGNEKAKTYFSDAKRLLAGKDLHVLQITDSNTLGLEGPCENGRPFFAMMKATGQSRKGDTSTGSYGIGKFAPFAVSELRTVFVTTAWADADANMHHYVQGKSVLMSHLDDLGQTRRGTGFWGLRQRCQPITELTADVPEWLRLADEDTDLQDVRGTMISVLGFLPTKSWENILAANIAENFFGAISRGDLEVEFESGIRIDANSLASLIADSELQTIVAEQPGEPDRLVHSGMYLNALNDNDNVIVESTENLHLGECVLRLVIGENLPKRVAVLRNGMLITESLQGLRRFSDFKEFVAVLECRTERGSALLRAMEPPRHDAFEPDRLPPDQRTKGKTALRELSEWVRKMLARHAKDPVSEETPLDELADFFGEEDSEGTGRQKDENPGGAIVIRARRVHAKKNGPVGGSSASAEDEGDEIEAENSADDGPGIGSKEGGSGGGQENEESGGTTAGVAGGAAVAVSRTVATGLPLRDVRAVVIGPTKRRIGFTTAKNATLAIQLQDSGADTNYALQVVSTNVGTLEAGKITGVFATGGVRCVLDVELANDFLGTVRVVANAI